MTTNDPYFWTSIYGPQHLKINGVDFKSNGAPTVGYAFSLLYDIGRLTRRARRESVGAFHSLHLKRLLQHVIVSSGNTDQKVVVSLAELSKLATDQARQVYHDHCQQASAMSMEEITNSFIDRNSRSSGEISRVHRPMENCRIYPEVVGCGEQTPWTKVLTDENLDLRGVQKAYANAVAYSSFVLDDWLGDDLLIVQRQYLVTGTLLALMRQEKLSGFTATPVAVHKTGKFPQIEKVSKSISKDDFFRLELSSDSKCDLYNVANVAIYANSRAIDVLTQARMRYALFLEGSP